MARRLRQGSVPDGTVLKDNRPTEQLITITGLKTKSSDVEIGFLGQSVASNVDITRGEKAKRRKGSTKVYTGTVTAAYSNKDKMFLLESTELKQLLPDYTTTTIKTGLTNSSELHAYTLGGHVYYSNGYETGVILPGGSGRTLGLTRPSSVAFLSASFGRLPAGTYQVATTFVRDDGQESGASVPDRIDLTDEFNGILINLQSSSDSSVEFVRVYITTTDGSELFLAGEVDNGTTTYVFREDTKHLQIPLVTGCLDKPPVFSEIDFHGSRMIYVVNNLLMYSIPFSYELVDFRHNYIPFVGRVTMVGVVRDGVYIGTDTETFFLSGTDLANINQVIKVADYGVVPGSRVYGDGSIIGEGQTEEPLPIWTAKKGIVVGLPGGSLLNVTQKQADIIEGLKGTALFRQEDGQSHYVNVIQS